MIARLPPLRLAAVALIATALSTAGCFKKRLGDGCQKDTDCKGDRVCIADACQEPVVKDKPPVVEPTPASPHPGSQPAQNPNVMASDGLPVVIPPPSSPPPSVAEWESVTREVTVTGSSTLHCETKMLREWLRVNCRRYGADSPIEVSSTHTDGQQAYVFKNPGTVTSAVVQVVRGKEYRANFVWATQGRHWGAELTVSWPAAAARPVMRFAPM